MRRIYSEHVPWDVLDRTLMRAVGRRGRLELAVAVLPSQVARLPALALRCRDEDIKLIVWPLLEDGEGRWANSANEPQFEELLSRIFRDVPPSTLLIDLEPPIDWTRQVLSLKAPFRRPVPKVRGPGRFGGLATWARSQGWGVEAVVPHVIAYGERWEKHLGTPVSQLAADRVESMAYTSLFEGYGRGLVDRRVARDLLRRIASRSSAVALGVIGGGALGDERAYRDVTELADDVGIARAAGVERLSLYGLDGILARGPIEPWLDTFVQTPALARFPQRTRRGALLDAMTRALG